MGNIEKYRQFDRKKKYDNRYNDYNGTDRNQKKKQTNSKHILKSDLNDGCGAAQVRCLQK